MMKEVEKVMKGVVRESVKKCGEWYGFNVEEALKKLELEEEKVKKVEKEEIVMPFVWELVRGSGCAGLCYNRGLFTQCQKVKKESELYCKTCEKEASGSERGKPLLGTVSDRMESDLMEYRDAKGRGPVAYSRIMSQLGLSRERVEAEASRLGVTIPEEHFASEKKRGRPKVEKKKKAQAETVEDLLSKMVTDEDEAMSEAETDVMSESEEASSGEKEVTQSNEVGAEAAQKAENEAAEKEAKAATQKAEKEAKAATQKAEKEAKAATQKAEKEAKAAAQKAEKEAKAAAQKAEKEAKAAAQAAKKVEKEAKPKAKKVEKEVKPKGENEEAKPKAKEETSVAATSETTSKPKKVTVTRITIEGVEYLKTTENLLYNPQTKEEMGIYDPESKTIKPLPEESDDELDEDDYESDGN